MMMPHLHSLVVENGHFDIVKHILENTTDFDLSHTGKSPLFLAAENGYYDILVLLLHSKYNDITKSYLNTINYCSLFLLLFVLSFPQLFSHFLLLSPSCTLFLLFLPVLL
jgi:ankyrin repeat protein